MGNPHRDKRGRFASSGAGLPRPASFSAAGGFAVSVVKLPAAVRWKAPKPAPAVLEPDSRNGGIPVPAEQVVLTEQDAGSDA